MLFDAAPGGYRAGRPTAFDRESERRGPQGTAILGAER
jgi:hypothetical protein